MDDDYDGRWELATSQQELMLTRRDSKGELTATRHVTPLPLQLSPEFIRRTGLIVPMVAAARHLFFGLGSFLACQEDKTLDWLETSGPIRRLVPSLPHSLHRIAIGFDAGAGLIWVNQGRRIFYFDEDLLDPKLTFTRSGHLVSADRHRIHVHRLGTDSVERMTALDAPCPPVELLPGPNANEFTLVGAQKALIYAIQGPAQ